MRHGFRVTEVGCEVEVGGGAGFPEVESREGKVEKEEGGDGGFRDSGSVEVGLTAEILRFAQDDNDYFWLC